MNIRFVTEYISKTGRTEQVNYFFWDFGNPLPQIVKNKIK